MKLNKISSTFNKTKNTNSNLMLFGAALTAMLTLPTYAAEETKPQVENTDNIEVIQVRGLLGSMKEAALLKRTDGRIVDSIVATDIGKLPDNNIAESLQRIAGVSIASDFGVGESVSIRGLKQNRVELNGRSTVGDNRGGVSLSDFPSSFLKSVSVVKSPTADMIEGALGGTVSMETVRPLELNERTTAVSLDFEYADKTENWAPIFSGAIGDNWNLDNGGRVGAMLLLSYQDREIRQDEFFSKINVDDVDDLNGTAIDGKTIRREENTVQQFVESRERTAVNLSLQYEPASGDGMFYLDLNTTKRKGSQSGNSILVVGGAPDYTGATEDSDGVANGYNLVNDFAIPKSWSEFRETDSFSHAFGGEWALTDNLQVSGEISIASSESVTPDSEFNLRPIQKDHFRSEADAFASVAGENPYNNGFSVPTNEDFYHFLNVGVDQVGGQIPSVDFGANSDALTNPEKLAVRQFKTELDTTENDETAFRLDFELSDGFDLDWLPTVKAGFRATSRDYKFNMERYDAKDVYKKAYTTADGKPFAIWSDEYEAAFPGSFSTISYDNSFDQTGLSGANDLLTYQIFNADQWSNPAQAFANFQQAFAGTNFATTGDLASNMDTVKGEYRDITEDTTAFYLQGHLDFDDITAIVGVRYVGTDIESTSYVDGTLVTEQHDYSDVLPSLNVTYALSDETVVRFAAAKVMSRPDFDQLSAAGGTDNDIVTADKGALTIDPYRATQYDLSVEHYWGEGNAVAFAVFYKDVASFFSSEVSCVADPSTANTNGFQYQDVCLLNTAGVDNLEIENLSEFPSQAEGEVAINTLIAQGLTGINTDQVINGESGKVQGFELSYQQFMTFLPGAWSGLGVNVNYTYADSEQPNGNPLLDISENSFNAQIFWENEQFQARLAYNYRDEYLTSENEKRIVNVVVNDVPGNNYRDARGQLDFSASYDINEDITIVTSMTNLTGEHQEFITDYGNTWKYTEADRRLSFGVRAKF